MAQVILFGGGDGGGIRITANGIERIPPFDPALRLQLRAFNALIGARSLMPKKNGGRALGGVITKLSEVVLTQLQGLVGEIDADNGLIYQEGDSGFTCGSTGRPPMPFPRPIDSLGAPDQLLSGGMLDASKPESGVRPTPN